MAKSGSCLRVVGLGILVLIVVGVVGVLGADRYMSARLSAQEAAMIAAGVPVTAEELGFVPVAREENAATVYREAVAAIEEAGDGEDGEESFDPEAYRERFLAMHANPCAERGAGGRGDDDGDLLPLTEEELAAIDAWFGRSAPAYEALEEAWAREKSLWGELADGTSGAMTDWVTDLTSGLAEARELARQLVFKAIWEHARGDTAAALETIALCMRLANDVADAPLLITGMVRVAIGQMALSALGDIVSQADAVLEIPPRLQMELDVFKDRAMMVRILDGERWFLNGRGQEMGLGANFLGRVLIYTPNKLEMDEYHLIIREAAGESDFVRRDHLIASLEEAADEDMAWFRIPFNSLANMMVHAILPGLERYDHFLAQTHLAEQGIALAQYKVAHGVYPETLEEIGNLLGGGSLPQDPFSGKPFIYARDGDGFRLSSVGSVRDKSIGWCTDQ